jgi:hypothetical protein
MSKSNMSKLTFAAVAALVASIAQAEPASFIARLELSQLTSSEFARAR